MSLSAFQLQHRLWSWSGVLAESHAADWSSASSMGSVCPDHSSRRSGTLKTHLYLRFLSWREKLIQVDVDRMALGKFNSVYWIFISALLKHIFTCSLNKCNVTVNKSLWHLWNYWNYTSVYHSNNDTDAADFVKTNTCAILKPFGHGWTLFWVFPQCRCQLKSLTYGPGCSPVIIWHSVVQSLAQLQDLFTIIDLYHIMCMRLLLEKPGFPVNDFE